MHGTFVFKYMLLKGAWTPPVMTKSTQNTDRLPRGRASTQKGYHHTTHSAPENRKDPFCLSGAFLGKTRPSPRSLKRSLLESSSFFYLIFFFYRNTGIYHHGPGMDKGQIPIRYSVTELFDTRTKKWSAQIQSSGPLSVCMHSVFVFV